MNNEWKTKEKKSAIYELVPFTVVKPLWLSLIAQGLIIGKILLCIHIITYTLTER